MASPAGLAPSSLRDLVAPQPPPGESSPPHDPCDKCDREADGGQGGFGHAPDSCRYVRDQAACADSYHAGTCISRSHYRHTGRAGNTGRMGQRCAASRMWSSRLGTSRRASTHGRRCSGKSRRSWARTSWQPTGAGAEIGLSSAPWVDHPLVFWEVAEIEEAHRALVAAGAVPLGEIADGSLAEIGTADITHGDPTMQGRHPGWASRVLMAADGNGRPAPSRFLRLIRPSELEWRIWV